MTKLAAKLPDGEANGLAALTRQMVEVPEQVFLVIMEVDCSKITTNIDTGDVEPTARIRRVESIDGEDRDLATRMLDRAMQARTGKTVLPFDLETDVRDAVDDVDSGAAEDDSG